MVSKKVNIAIVLGIALFTFGVSLYVFNPFIEKTTLPEIGVPPLNTSPLSEITSTGQDVIIIHGFAGNDLGKQSVWNEVYGKLKERLEADGYKVHGPALPTDNPTTNAEFICNYMKQNNLANVALIGHSMGGLAARYCIKELGGLPLVSFYASIDTPQYGLSPIGCAVTTTQMCENSDFIKKLNEGDDTPDGPYWLDMTINFPPLEGSCHKDIPGLYTISTHRNAPSRTDVYQWIKQGLETKDVCGETPTPTGTLSPTIQTPSTPTVSPTQTEQEGLPLKFNFIIPGVGKNTNLGENAQPLGLEILKVSVELHGENNTLLSKGSVSNPNYNAQSGIFSDNIQITPAPQGNFISKIRTDNSLFKRVPGIFAYSGGEIDLPQVQLTTGDLNQDNTLDLSDYNILISCYGATSCPQKDLVDLNLDDKVDELDLNIFYAGLSNRHGD